MGNSVKRGGLGIPDPRSSAESVYNTSKLARGGLVGYLLGGTTLNYAGHRYFVHEDNAGARSERQHVDMVYLDRQKGLVGGQERNRLHRATSNGAWLSAIPHSLNITELSQEEFGMTSASDIG